MKLNRLGMVLTVLMLFGCASIPPEAPELSAELGKRISAVEDANITLLNRFFDLKRREVDRFIEEEWVPEFADRFFDNPTIADAWNTIVQENDKKQRLTFLIKTGPRLQKRINEKRMELIQPLDALERRIAKEIRDEFVQIRAMNNTITSFLLSASKVAENRNRYLGLVGVTDERIGKAIDKTDDAVADLVEKGSDAVGKVEKGKKYLEKIREIRDSILR